MLKTKVIKFRESHARKILSQTDDTDKDIQESLQIILDGELVSLQKKGAIIKLLSHSSVLLKDDTMHYYTIVYDKLA